MPSRSRSRYIDPSYHQMGSARALLVGLGDHDQTPTTQPHYYQYSEDTTGNRLTTNPLNLVKEDWVAGWVNGQNGPAWDCSAWGIRKNWTYVPSGMDDRNDDVIGTIALARSNPSRPGLNVWNFLFELKDIPDMVKSAFKYMRKYGPNPKKNWPKSKGSDVFQEMGDIYLNWTFGWDLLIKDIGKMVDFIAEVEKRQQDLNDLKSGILRKTVHISNTFTTDSSEFYWGPLYSAVSTLRLTLEGEREIWVRVRYKPTSETFKFLGQDNARLARRLAFGHDIHIDTLYNALPWSWFVDWFTSAGDYFAAQRNTLGVQVDDVAIMRHTTLKIKSFDFTYNPYNATLMQNGDWGWDQKSRSRWTGSPVIQAWIPNLGAKQLSILAALGTKYFRA